MKESLFFPVVTRTVCERAEGRVAVYPVCSVSTRLQHVRDDPSAGGRVRAESTPPDSPSAPLQTPLRHILRSPALLFCRQRLPWLRLKDGEATQKRSNLLLKTCIHHTSRFNLCQVGPTWFVNTVHSKTVQDSCCSQARDAEVKRDLKRRALKTYDTAELASLSEI